VNLKFLLNLNKKVCKIWKFCTKAVLYKVPHKEEEDAYSLKKQNEKFQSEKDHQNELKKNRREKYINDFLHLFRNRYY